MGLHIVFTKGSIFKSSAEVLVNPVNTVGVMGAGLALQFKTKYPKNYKHYHAYCKSVKSFKEYDQCFLSEKDKIIYNLPTKENYNQFSSLTDVGNVEDQIYNMTNAAFGTGLRSARLQTN